MEWKVIKMNDNVKFVPETGIKLDFENKTYKLIGSRDSTAAKFAEELKKEGYREIK